MKKIFVCILAAIFLFGSFPFNAFAAVEQEVVNEVLNFGLIAELTNVNEWYNMGLNPNMTGGTAGRIYVGEQFLVLSREPANNSYGYCYYVYAAYAGLYGYVSPYYLRFHINGELVNINNWYNMGINPEMTGGTAGTIYAGEKFVCLERIDTSYGHCYYVYAINAGLYGYVSANYMYLY